MFSLLKAFVMNAAGQFTIIGGIAIVPVIATAGLALDFAMIRSNTTALQQIADAASLAGVSELSISGTSPSDLDASIGEFVQANLDANSSSFDGDAVIVKTDVSDDRTSLTVDLKYPWKSFLMSYLDHQSRWLEVRSIAKLAQTEAVCVLALNTTGGRQIEIQGAAELVAEGCAVHVNSNASDALTVSGKGFVGGSNIYISGGFSGPAANLRPNAATDSPTILDPLAERTAPNAGPCDEKNFRITSGSALLHPGTYCGGITVTGNSDVELKPGVYVLKDGPLELNGSGIVHGDHVGFYFDGDLSVASIGTATSIRITAPKSGPLAGILLFENRSAKPGRLFTIAAGNAELLEGTIYLSRARLVVDGRSRVGQLARWTAIVAGGIEISNGPEIHLNSDYRGSDVPVPEGIAGPGKARLIH